MANNPKWPWVYLVISLRRIFRWSPARKAVKARCVVTGKKDLFECEKCELPTKKIEIDHIEPVGPAPRDYDGWDRYIRRMFVEADQLMGLCKPCHLEKSRKEAGERKKLRDERKSKST